MSRAAINAQLFNQLASIYGQMGKGVPARPAGASGGDGRYTNWLRGAIAQGQSELSNYQAQKAADSQRAAQQRMEKQIKEVKKAAEAAKKAEAGGATQAQAGGTVRRPGQKRKKTTLASLRIKPKQKINQQVGGISASGSGLNIGGYA